MSEFEKGGEKRQLILDDRWIKKVKKLDNSVKQRISKIFDDLEIRPEEIGKYLTYTGGRLKEVYVGSYRLYFSILPEAVIICDLEYKIVCVLDLIHKDEQREGIKELNKTLDTRISKAIQKFVKEATKKN